jgi:hypothetical protein
MAVWRVGGEIRSRLYTIGLPRILALPEAAASPADLLSNVINTFARRKPPPPASKFARLEQRALVACRSEFVSMRNRFLRSRLSIERVLPSRDHRKRY